MTIAVKPKLESYFEVEITKNVINLLERAGHGRTDKIINLLKEYGLDLTVKISAPCG